MRRVLLAHAVDWHGWRDAARNLALGAVPPEQVLWSVLVRDDLFVADTPGPAPAGTLSVPRSLMTLGETVIQHSDPQRFALLYRLLWRIHQGERHLMDQPTDPVITRVRRLAQAVRRDTHKMRAFLRFREIRDDSAIRHVGWFEPSHFIVEANAGFFVRRFAGMTWSILTPYRSAHWTGAALTFTAGARAADVPDDDRLAAYWDVYFASIFNPARLKVAAMRSEMPQKYWRNLPEAAAIPDLVRGAAARTQAMLDRPRLSPPRPSARQFRPAPPRANSPLAQARQDIAGCTRCPLHGPATQPVFGEGPADAALMLIGAQPGDHDDLGGRPFTGPAGQLLDSARDFRNRARTFRAGFSMSRQTHHAQLASADFVQCSAQFGLK